MLRNNCYNLSVGRKETLQDNKIQENGDNVEVVYRNDSSNT